MKVLLLQKLAGRGKMGDIVEVNRGFAVNYLIPRKIAVEVPAASVEKLRKVYRVRIVERLTHLVEIEASGWEEAMSEANKKYRREEVVLDYSNFDEMCLERAGYRYVGDE